MRFGMYVLCLFLFVRCIDGHADGVQRKIRLRLHGTRLPKNYTILLRLDKASDIVRPATTVPRKRRRRESTRAKAVKSRRRSTSSPSPGASSPHSDEADSPANLTDSEETDHQIRLNNAYPGSTNSIGSIHQRRWFITLDRVNSGFEPDHSTRTETGKKTWTRRRDPETGELLGFELFYVRGPDTERSVVTGRLGREIMEDEGVKGFVRRRAWRAVLN